MSVSTPSPHAASDATARDAIIQTLSLFEMTRMRAATTARRHPTRGFAATDPASNSHPAVARGSVPSGR